MDQQTFEHFYATHVSMLQRFVYFRMPTKHDGDDVLQEIALAVFSAKNVPADEPRQKAWLLGLARHKCADFFRRHYARERLPLRESLVQTRAGLDVQETLSSLAERDQQALTMFYLEGQPQAEIAARLGIPVGTVKSRLHTARQNFKQNYQDEGEIHMKTLPATMPEYTIEQLPLSPFEVRCEELIGWFLVPRLGEKLSWADYDFPERKRTGVCKMEAVGRAIVHGIEGVEITVRNQNGELTRTFVAQMTDTHVRYLAENHFEDGVRKCYTFLDGDAFLNNWGFGPDNCGTEITLTQKGIITREGSVLTAQPIAQVIDVVGRYAVTLGGVRHDTVCLMGLQAYENGIWASCTEQFIGQDGRTVLWRRYNHNDWNKRHYDGRQWTETLPSNDRLTINGETYVHWYDCISDHVVT